MFYLQHKKHDIWVGSFDLFPKDLVIHAVSTRLGGVTAVPYDTMDLALHTGDAPELVWQNRQRFCAALGLDAARICTPEQVHGERILQVMEADAGRGSLAYEDALPGTDALITDVPNLPLLLCFADCTPILFVDPVHRAIGAAHGGWKGTVRKIAQKTVLRMQQVFGTRPEDCLIGIGPAIGPCCYEIGPEVAEQFRAAFPLQQADILQQVGSKVHVNLWEANRQQLLAAGVRAEHIDSADVCTACNAKLFFSYRADAGHTGRIATVIALRDNT